MPGVGASDRKDSCWDRRAFVTNEVLEGDHMRRHVCRRGTHECARHIVDKLVDVDVRNRRVSDKLERVTVRHGHSVVRRLAGFAFETIFQS